MTNDACDNKHVSNQVRHKDKSTNSCHAVRFGIVRRCLLAERFSPDPPNPTSFFHNHPGRIRTRIAGLTSKYCVQYRVRGRPIRWLALGVGETLSDAS